MNKILGSGLFSDQPFSFAPQGTVKALSKCNINEASRSSEDAHFLYFYIFFSSSFFLLFDDTEKEIIPSYVYIYIFLSFLPIINLHKYIPPDLFNLLLASPL